MHGTTLLPPPPPVQEILWAPCCYEMILLLLLVSRVSLMFLTFTDSLIKVQWKGVLCMLSSVCEC